MNDVKQLQSGMITLYHNEDCSKSRATFERISKRLPDSRLQLKVIHYLEEPLSFSQLFLLFDQLFKMGYRLSDCVREHEDRFSELGLTTDDLKDDQMADLAKRNRIIQILVENPILIERPIISYNGRSVIGRPPENVDKLF